MYFYAARRTIYVAASSSLLPPTFSPHTTHPVHSPRSCPCTTMPCCSAALGRDLSGKGFFCTCLKWAPAVLLLAGEDWLSCCGGEQLTATTSAAAKARWTPQPRFPTVSPIAYPCIWLWEYACMIFHLRLCVYVCSYIAILSACWHTSTRCGWEW